MNSIERSGLICPEPAEALCALLEVADPGISTGSPLPLLWHWLYLLEHPAQSTLGPDGHPARDTIPVPPAVGLRRMWAGGRVTSRRALRIGDMATRRTSVLSTVAKQGASGPLTFVTVSHLIRQRGELCVEEEQDLVYLPATPMSPRSDEDAALAAAGGPTGWTIPVTAPLLFRFSALTYNAHRIHYDRDYARDVEGYPSLVVHGPLQVLAMAEGLRRRRTPPTPIRFDYRLVAPLFEHQGMHVHVADETDKTLTQVCDDTGRITARGTLLAP